LLKTFKPIADELQPYIEVFYVFNSDKPDRFSYIAFPHTNTAISFFKDASITRNNFHVTIEQNPKAAGSTCIEMLGKYTQPVFVHYNGDFEEVAVVFKPMGINRFISGDLVDQAPEYSQPFTDGNWQNCCQQLFDEKEKRIELLEAFLKSQLRHTAAMESMDEAIRYFEDNRADYTVEQVAALTGMSLKTFQRNFKKHLACSPSAYKRIAKFRNALNSKIVAREMKSLTSVAYDSNYSDQSYFIREFKKLSNLNPRRVFKVITVLDNEKIIWELK
jgi:AraC-like DNA-binding protein